MGKRSGISIEQKARSKSWDYTGRAPQAQQCRSRHAPA
jgi:hypothetical protein